MIQLSDKVREENRRMINNMMIKKCLFSAVGYGTRFLPAIKATPKEMLPILTKPFIQYGVEKAMSAGMDIIGIIAERGKRAIEDYFNAWYELKRQVKVTNKEYLSNKIQVISNLKISHLFTYFTKAINDKTNILFYTSLKSNFYYKKISKELFWK